MITTYEDNAAYVAAGMPTDESRVALIKDTNEVKIDGINVVTSEPEKGDVLFIDASGKKIFLKGGAELNASLIPAGWTWIGVVISRKGNKVKILDKANSSSMKWLACWQYAITAISSTSITIKVRMSNNYGAYTDVPVTLTSASVNAQSASEISAAIAAKATAVGDTNAWWAWYDSDNNRIIVQTDNCANYQQSNVAGTNCTIALSVWEDMPASSALWRKNGAGSTYGGQNLTRFVAYYSTNGTVPTANVDPNAATQVKRSCFEDPEDAAYAYCADLRAKYGTYEAYMADQCVMYPQKYGAFAMIDAKEMTAKYGNATAPTKGGSTMYKFPALHYGATKAYDSDGLRAGDWWLSDITDGMEYMADEGYTTGINAAAVKQKYNHSIAKMGGTQVLNNAYRWFGRRYSSAYAWFFYGDSGTLNNGYVSSSLLVQAVTLLDVE